MAYKRSNGNGKKIDLIGYVKRLKVDEELKNNLTQAVLSVYCKGFYDLPNIEFFINDAKRGANGKLKKVQKVEELIMKKYSETQKERIGNTKYAAELFASDGDHTMTQEWLENLKALTGEIDPEFESRMNEICRDAKKTNGNGSKKPSEPYVSGFPPMN